MGEVPATQASAPEDPFAGDYAIVECYGHRKLSGRVIEVDRFGGKFLQVEPFFRGVLLPPVLIGAGAIYSFTPCSAEIALNQQQTTIYSLPDPVRAILPPLMDGDEGERDHVEFGGLEYVWDHRREGGRVAAEFDDDEIDA